MVRDSREKLSFYKSLLCEDQRILKNYDWMWHYSSGSLYYDGVKSFKENFSNVKIIKTENLSNNTESTVKEILNFLELNSNLDLNLNSRYSNSGKPKFF